jgi:hypothetical protein
VLSSFDATDILFRALTASEELKAELSGGIYTTERPDDSDREDITVNTITLTGDMPQRGTSNVNIHVPDMKLNIGGREQWKEDRERLRKLTQLAITVLETSRAEGMLFWVASQTTLQDTEIKHHFTNLRIEWNICKNSIND